MQASISKWGNGQGVRLNKGLLDVLNLKVDDPIDISVKNNKIIISKLEEKPKVTMKSLFENYKGDYKPELVDFGEPVGREIW